MDQTLDASMEKLVCVVDDDAEVRDSIGSLLRASGFGVMAFAGRDEFLASDALDAAGCLVLDVRLGGADGLDLQQELAESATRIPIILISGYADVPMTVRAMRAGAITFLPKPFDDDALLAAIGEAVEIDRLRREQSQQFATLRARYESLTPRERDVLGLVTAGLMNKQIAGRLELSEITVKIHRGNLMRKMAADSLPDLVRMAERLGVSQPVSRYAHP